MLGSVTRKNVCQIEAPSVRAASSSSSPISSSTGTTSRIVNGMQMKIVTSTIDGNAKMIWMPRSWKNGASQPPGPNRITAREPDRHRRERERQVDQRVHQAPPVEPLAHQHPRDDDAEQGRHHDGDHA